MMRKFLLPFILLFALQAGAKSLEWQRIELEETINNKYVVAISSVLDRTEFLVKTEVKYSDPGMPDFQDLNKSSFKISDLPFDESKGDYIAFAKVGLEVPVVGKMHQEHQKKLKELYRYNESFDLFKNIQSIGVNVAVSDTVSPKKLEVVKNIVKNLEFSVAGFKPKVEVKNAKIKLAPEKKNEEGAVKPEDEIGLKDVMEFLGQFGNAIGLILAVALFGFLAFKLLRLYMEFMEKLKAMEEPASEPKNEEEDQQKQFAPMPPEAQKEQGAHEVERPSFERFQRLLELNKKQAAILLKRWLKRDDGEASMILTAIAQQLDPEALDLLFEEVTPQEREKWNTCISGYLDGESLSKANAFISEGVMKELVGGSFVEDHELVDLILGMTADSVREFILKGGENGKALANLLSPEVISEMLDELSFEEMDKVISESMEFDFSEFSDNLDAFKQDLKQFCEQTIEKPFNNKLLQVISEVSPEREAVLYRHMASECKRSDLVNAAKRRFPSELVLKMPKTFLKVSMQNYPMDKKVTLLAALEEDQRQNLMDSFLEEGSNAKEMIMMELETIMEDELAMKRTQASRGQIWKEFLDYVRGAAAADEQHQPEFDMLIADWIDEMRGGESAAA